MILIMRKDFLGTKNQLSLIDTNKLRSRPRSSIFISFVTTVQGQGNCARSFCTAIIAKMLSIF